MLHCSYGLKTGGGIKAMLKRDIRETNMHTKTVNWNKTQDSTKMETFREKVGMQNLKCYNSLLRPRNQLPFRNESIFVGDKTDNFPRVTDAQQWVIPLIFHETLRVNITRNVQNLLVIIYMYTHKPAIFLLACDTCARKIADNMEDLRA